MCPVLEGGWVWRVRTRTTTPGALGRLGEYNIRAPDGGLRRRRSWEVDVRCEGRPLASLQDAPLSGHVVWPNQGCVRPACGTHFTPGYRLRCLRHRGKTRAWATLSCQSPPAPFAPIPKPDGETPSRLEPLGLRVPSDRTVFITLRVMSSAPTKPRPPLGYPPWKGERRVAGGEGAQHREPPELE